MKSVLHTVAFIVIGVFAVSQVRAETAVSIEYDFVERPAHVPGTLVPSTGVALRFLAIKAIDGERIDAALWQPTDRVWRRVADLLGARGHSVIAPTMTGVDAACQQDRSFYWCVP